MWTVGLTIGILAEFSNSSTYCEQRGPNVALFQFTVHCDDIEFIDHCLLAIVVFNAFGAVLALSGSIIGCMGTCCAQQNVSLQEIFT